MNKLYAACAYIIKNSKCENIRDLRLNHLLFLVDVRSFKERNESLTGKDWVCNPGLFIKNNLSSLLEASSVFELHLKKHTFNTRTEIHLSDLYKFEDVISSLNDFDKLIISTVIQKTDELNFRDLDCMIYQSHPFQKETIYCKMDLSC